MNRILLVLFLSIIHFYYAQKSCVNFFELKGKGIDAVNKIRPLSANGWLIAGNTTDTLYKDAFLTFNTSSPSAFAIEMDANNNVLNTIYFSLINTTSSDYITCVDVLKDNNNDYYLLINWTGNLKLSNNTIINGNNSTILIKTTNTSNVIWYYYLNNAEGTGMCFDKNGHIVFIANSPTVYSYNPSTLIILNIHKNTGQIRKTKIGNNYFNIYSGKIENKNDKYYFLCKYADSIKFNNQKISGTGYSSAIVVMDSNFNVLKYATLSSHSTSNQSIYANDFYIDNADNVYITGSYKPNNLYINDTIRLNKSNSIIDQMYLVKLNANLNYVWAKQENQNPTNIASNNLRLGYKLTSDNYYVYVLSYMFNSIILGIDTMYGISLIVVQYDWNGQYIQSEKIAGAYINGNYTLNYFNNALILSSTYGGSVSVCQNTITSIGQTDVYVSFLDKLTNVPKHTNEEIIIHIFPNPANNNVMIQTLSNEPIHYTLLDVSGKQVETGWIMNNQLSTAHLKDGFYLLQVNSKDGIQTKKLIVQH